MDKLGACWFQLIHKIPLCLSKQSRFISRMPQKDDNDHSYTRAIERLNQLQTNKKTIALAKYNHPEDILPLFSRQLSLAGISTSDLDQLKIIHIGGTKGKGSTGAFIETILKNHGYKIGFYNSPHLVRVNERIRLDGKPICNHLFGKYFHQVYDRLIDASQRENISMPTYFSFLTILAFHIFLRENLDCAIIEVGIGGKYDPTNVIVHPVACGITTLDYDHTNILGKSIESIAENKAGICKKGAPLFTVVQDHKNSTSVLERCARQKGSPFYVCQPLLVGPDAQLGIKGLAQRSNAALACQIARYFINESKRIASDTINGISVELATEFKALPEPYRRALEECSWDGRCQTIKTSKTTFFLDGAHTRKSIENCLDWFVSASNEDDPEAIKILMVNIIGDRDRRDLLKPLSMYHGFERVIFSPNVIELSSYQQGSDNFQRDKTVDSVQCNMDAWNHINSSDSQKNSPVEIVSRVSISDSMEYIVKLSEQYPKRNLHILATGSLHFVGGVLACINKFHL